MIYSLLYMCNCSDANGEATIIPNEEGETVSNGGDKLPDTPVSQRNTAFYANEAAVEGSPKPKRATEQVGMAFRHMTLM